MTQHNTTQGKDSLAMQDTVTIAADDNDIRLDRWFKRHRPGTPHALIAQWARIGQIRLAGKRVAISDRLVAGQVLSLPRPAVPIESRPHPRAAAPPLDDSDVAFAQSLVIHRDSHALVLAKPPGLPTQGGTRTLYHIDRLLDGLRFGLAARPKLVHRLDKDTSGVLLVARTSTAAGFFSKSFASRRARKIYWALVVGVPAPAEGHIKLPLAKMAGSGGEKMQVVEPNASSTAEGRETLSATTRYRTIATIGQHAAWVELHPLTGRTHQLRVHMAAIGHPIVGDSKYGGRDAFLTGAVSRKLHLHARRLRIAHPEGTVLDVCADLPEHMAASFATLGLDESEGDALETERGSGSVEAKPRKVRCAPSRHIGNRTPSEQRKQSRDRTSKRTQKVRKATRR